MPTVIDRRQVQTLVRRGAQLIEVLGPKEYEAEHLPGAINIPLKIMGPETTRRLDTRRPVITYCHDYQWDMSARAASRLATLGFADIYRYQAGKADWFAAGLPREGSEAHVPRVADVAKRNVPTCALHERVGDLRERVRVAGHEICVVVDSEHIVLGIVEADALSGDPGAVVESVMKSDPVTFRPHLRTGEIPDYVRKRPVPHVLVTTSDGVLVGVLPCADLPVGH